MQDFCLITMRKLIPKLKESLFASLIDNDTKLHSAETHTFQMKEQFDATQNDTRKVEE